MTASYIKNNRLNYVYVNRWRHQPKSRLINYFDSIHYIKNNRMNPCVKTEGKCNESVNNEFKIMSKKDSLHQITRVSK